MNIAEIIQQAHYVYNRDGTKALLYRKQTNSPGEIAPPTNVKKPQKMNFSAKRISKKH